MESTEPANREVTAPASSLSEGDAKSRRRYSFPLLCLALWVLVIAIGIEWYNYRAGFYLPRTDWIHDPGKWRVSRWLEPRDELRYLVQSHGLYQYPLALILIAWSLIDHFVRRTSHSVIFNFTCASIGLLALILAIYRGYFTSLGW
jgi:hypothetical protein